MRLLYMSLGQIILCYSTCVLFETNSLLLVNSHDQTVKIWIWDYDKSKWVYSAPIVLRPKYQVDPLLRPGKYQLVFQNKDNVLIRRDTWVIISDDKRTFRYSENVPRTVPQTITDGEGKTQVVDVILSDLVEKVGASMYVPTVPTLTPMPAHVTPPPSK
jgi:hypothetical protein